MHHAGKKKPMSGPIKLTQLHQIALQSSDLERSRAFYEEKLGARFIAKYDPPGLLFFDFGGVRILLEDGARTATVYFRVDEIHSAFEALKERGIEFTDSPHIIFKDDAGTFGKAGKEEWMVFFEDPDGNVLALASQQ